MSELKLSNILGSAYKKFYQLINGTDSVEQEVEESSLPQVVITDEERKAAMENYRRLSHPKNKHEPLTSTEGETIPPVLDDELNEDYFPNALAVITTTKL